MERTQGQARIALGLFHFNVQYVAGDQYNYHRYCSEAVIPFLLAVARHPIIRVTFEMAGNGLEFLARHYPSSIKLLRTLIDRGQIELISATYTPTIWVAFPKRDLVYSIKLNRRTLASIDLKASNVFFAQEAFFGAGLSEVSDLFEFAICKDEYLRYHRHIESPKALYRVGDLKVVIGANHLLNVFSERSAFFSDTALQAAQKQLRERASSLPGSSPAFIHGVCAGVEWRWYHCGSGHHFVSGASPLDQDAFFADEQWTSQTIAYLLELSNSYKLATVSEFVRATQDCAAEPLSGIVEAGWNSDRSRGVFTWMGRHESAHDQNTHVLGLAWRSRDAVMRCQSAIESMPESDQQKMRPKLDELWRGQLLAESSDPLGWRPTAGEVQFGRRSAEEVLRIANILWSHLLEGSDHKFSVLENNADNSEETSVGIHRTAIAVANSMIESFGAKESISHWTAGEDIEVIDVRLEPTAVECGVRFRRHSSKVRYCHSAAEHKISTIDLDKLRPEHVYLPLSNGLIDLGEDVFLVRLNRYGQASAKLSKTPILNVEFVVSGFVINKLIHWRFLVFRGNANDAVVIANSANSV